MLGCAASWMLRSLRHKFVSEPAARHYNAEYFASGFIERNKYPTCYLDPTGGYSSPYKSPLTPFLGAASIWPGALCLAEGAGTACRREAPVHPRHVFETVGSSIKQVKLRPKILTTFSPRQIWILCAIVLP